MTVVVIKKYTKHKQKTNCCRKSNKNLNLKKKKSKILLNLSNNHHHHQRHRLRSQELESYTAAGMRTNLNL